MSLFSYPSRRLTIIVFQARRFFLSELQFSSSADNTELPRGRQLANLDLEKAVSVIDLELKSRQETMLEETQAAKLPKSPDILRDSKPDPVVPTKPAWRWIPTSPELLQAAEKRILNFLKIPYTGRFVNIGPVVGLEDNKIWTISMNEKSENLPVVLLHGLGAGVGYWVLNLDALAADRPVYTFDNLGFARSSRPNFSSDPATTERQYIDAIEEWRKRLNLEKFVLVGHSFGGFLATSYSIAYPSSVAHLVLADPWGFPEMPEIPARKIPWHIKTLMFVLKPLLSLNPLWGLRAAGPWGPALVQKVRPDIIRKFDELNQNGTDVKFGEYAYHCNAQKPTGESAFRTLTQNFAWARFPLIRRIPRLAKEIDITAMYGERSFISPLKEEDFSKQRPDAYVKVHILEGAAHHMYSDAKDKFNNIISEACAFADEKLRRG